MIIGSTQIGARLMTRFPPALLMAPGFLVAAPAWCILAQINLDARTGRCCCPALILLGLGMGTAFTPA